MKRVIGLFGGLILTSTVLASGSGNPGGDLGAGPINVPTEGIVDGVFIQQHIPTKRMIPYEFVREADMMWSKRTWDYIDLREKINLSLYYPLDDIRGEGDDQIWVKNMTRWSLWTVIRTHVMNGDLMVFSPYHEMDLNRTWSMDGDQLKYPVVPVTGKTYYTDQVYRDKVDLYYLGNRIDLVPPQEVYDAQGNIMQVPVRDDQGLPMMDPYTGDTIMGDSVIKYVPEPILSKDIVQYRLKEDWFFDKERSVLDVRIIALSPVVYDEQNGQIKGLRELFWLYFPHCRFVFNNYFVYNDRNDSQWMSYDDLFWKRRFNMVTYKASNTYDRDVESYRHGVDALYESEKIKEEIRRIEHDVWSF